MRFDEIKTLDDCDHYLEQMNALYSMPKNTEHYHDWWTHVIAEVSLKRYQIMEENKRKFELVEQDWGDEVEFEYVRTL